MQKAARVHLLGPRLSGRVVRVLQLPASRVREIGNQALELAPDDVNGMQLRMLELQCALPQVVHSVTRLPVIVWEPSKPLGKKTAKEEQDGRPKDDHEVRGDAIVITKKGDDGLDNLQEGDWVRLTAQELEMSGPKSWDNVFDSPETQVLERIYAHLHDAPPQAVLEMLSGKARPVPLEG